MMLAQEFKQELVSDQKDYAIQQKLDGCRYNLRLSKDRGVELMGRHSNKLNNYKYPEIVAEATQLIRDYPITLDGELCVSTTYGMWELTNFNAIQSREHTENKKQIELLSRCLPAKFIVFDILAEGTNELTLKERIDIMQMFFGQYPQLRHIKLIYSAIGTMDLATKLFQQAQGLGLEGIMIKDLDSLYEDKRSNAWLKWKTYKEEDLKIIGYTSKGREISALILENGSKVNAIIDEQMHDFIIKQDISIKKETSEEMQYYFSKPSLTAVVKYLEKTEQGALRFPVLKEIR
ncbi:MAG: RNA ligase family protein [Candidatus Micrarchaeaceae archaeon]